MNLVRKLEAIVDEIADLARAIQIERRKIEIHEQSAAEHRAAAAALRLQHGEDAELPPEVRYGLDVAERMAIEARAELARLQKRLAGARTAFIGASHSQFAATMIVDRALKEALGLTYDQTPKSGLSRDKLRTNTGH
jgi:hypothetical protein